MSPVPYLPPSAVQSKEPRPRFSCLLHAALYYWSPIIEQKYMQTRLLRTLQLILPVHAHTNISKEIQWALNKTEHQ